MTEPKNVADELVRRAYADASVSSFDISAALADLHARISEAGLTSALEADVDPACGLATPDRSSSAANHPGVIADSWNSGDPQADMRPTTVGLRRGARVTGSTRDKLAADLKRKYERGASIRALAESTGRSYGFVHRVLSEAGVQLRGREGVTRTKKK